MTIAIGSDHGAYEVKEDIRAYFQEAFPAIEVLDMGTHEAGTSVDYPDYGAKVIKAVLDNTADRGIVLCGTGLGISITANRFKGIRAALCHDAFTARMSRLHNDSNVLALGGRTTGKDVARDIVKIWLETPFEGGRHQRRLDKIESYAERLEE